MAWLRTIAGNLILTLCLITKSSVGWDAKNFKKPTDAQLRQQLTPTQYRITQQEGTEPPFQNAFYKHHEKGIYVDIVSKQPLFSSDDKYDSGTGWPSFKKPIRPDAVIERLDRDGNRTEVKSSLGGAHLGHVFKDGPPPTGNRYCMNSAALEFIPAKDLKARGYSEYATAFEEPKPSPSSHH